MTAAPIRLTKGDTAKFLDFVRKARGERNATLLALLLSEKFDHAPSGRTFQRWLATTGRLEFVGAEHIIAGLVVCGLTTREDAIRWLKFLRQRNPKWRDCEAIIFPGSAKTITDLVVDAAIDAGAVGDQRRAKLAGAVEATLRRFVAPLETTAGAHSRLTYDRFPAIAS